jgi:hypothetical protein
MLGTSGKKWIYRKIKSGISIVLDRAPISELHLSEQRDITNTNDMHDVLGSQEYLRLTPMHEFE